MRHDLCMAATALALAACFGGKSERTVDQRSAIDLAGIKTCSQYPGEAQPVCNDDSNINVVYAAALQRCGGCAYVAVWISPPTSPSVENVAYWSQRKDLVIAFFTPVSKYPESTRASLEKLVDAQLQIKGYLQGKANALDAKLNAVKNGAHDWIVQQGTARVGAAQAELVEVRQKVSAVDALTQEYAADIALMAAPLKQVITRYRDYRATEQATVNALERASDEGTAATVVERFADIKVGLASVSQTESLAAQELELEAKRVRRRLESIQAAYDAALAPYAQFLVERNLPHPDLAAEPVAALDEMMGYARRREQRVADAIIALLGGLNHRLAVLMLTWADEATRQATADAAFLRASQAFLAQVNAQVASMLKVPPKGPKLKLPYLTDQYQRTIAFLQLAPLCGSTSPSWAQPGCAVLNVNLAKAKNMAEKSIPGTIKLGAAVLRNKGADPDVCAQIELAVAQKRISTAVLLYDTTVRHMESLP
jgi:hypothetical protein